MKKGWLIWLVFLTVHCYGQSDTLFWFAAPDISSGHSDNPIFLRVVNGTQNTSVTIDMPGNLTFTPITFSILPFQSRSIDLTPFKAQIEAGASLVVSNKGIRIRSSQKVQAFYEIVSNGKNKDLFSLKGQNALGLHFFIPGQDFWENDSVTYTPKPRNAFEIVATENNTTVTIVVSQDALGGLQKGSTRTVILQKGQTYSVKARYFSAGKKLTGTEVTSNKKIAITFSDDSIRNWWIGRCADVIGDQIVPVNTVGTDYIPVRGYYNGRGYRDHMYITATQNGTQVYINGSATPFQTLNKGETLKLRFFSTDCALIVTSKPAYVLQISGFGCELGAALLPHVQCTGSKNVEITRSSAEPFFILVIVPTGGESTFSTTMTANNIIQATDFFNVPGTGGVWKYMRKELRDIPTELTNGSSTRISNSQYPFHLSIINGGAQSGCLFGYFSDFLQVQTSPIYHY